MRVTILHLDLGIGGAEQLIVNIATVLKELGHDVTLLTTHHDKNHCFEETKPSGHLGPCVSVYGDWIPRQLFGKFTAFFAILRMLYLALIASFFYRDHADLIILDGVSAPVPLLKLFGLKVLFYCHFPDMLLCYDRSNWLKRCYRLVLDTWEEWSTGCADEVLVNSEFTAQIYLETFTKLAKRPKPEVLYPVVKEVPEAELPDDPAACTPYTQGYDRIFLSLNRYERKKNILLAISALQHYKSLQQQHTGVGKSVLLVVAGGYDTRVQENVDYLQELQRHCEQCGLTYRFLPEATDLRATTSSGSSTSNTAQQQQQVDVVFRVSIPSRERSALLLQCTGLLYTPDREHFGIVPIEAMYLKVPVIAVNSGGPKETVRNGETGFLCRQEAEDFALAMMKLQEPNIKPSSGDGKNREILSDYMGEKAKTHVQEKFSFDSMKENLKNILERTMRTDTEKLN